MCSPNDLPELPPVRFCVLTRPLGETGPFKIQRTVLSTDGAIAHWKAAWNIAKSMPGHDVRVAFRGSDGSVRTWTSDAPAQWNGATWLESSPVESVAPDPQPRPLSGDTDREGARAALLIAVARDIFVRAAVMDDQPPVRQKAAKRAFEWAETFIAELEERE